MTSGIVTELNEILDIPPSNNYKQKLLDEMGDAFWYISNYCNLHNIVITLEPKNPEGSSLYWGCKLLDYDKKNLAYNKPYNREMQIEAVQQLTSNLVYKAISFSLTISEVLDKNIEKLRIRFPDKFDQNLAINKDDSKESEIFK